MIGIIAGEIIGSPFRKENLPDINDIFFPLFEDRRVMDEKTYRERTYRAAPGRITEAVLSLGDDINAFLSSETHLGEAMCQAVVIGRMDARHRMSFDEHAASVASFARFFPESMHPHITEAADAAYRLERKMGSGLYERMGLVNPPNAEVVSAMLKGQLIPERDGTYVPGDGKADESVALQGAFCAVGQSRSWEEAVRRAAALGGDSALVAALAGGLAEIAFGVPETISYRAMEYLDRNRQDILRRSENRLPGDGGEQREFRSPVAEQETLISVLSLPGRAKVYAIPEGRPDIERTIRKVNPDSVFVSAEGMARVVERLESRRGADGQALGGTFIDSERPELHRMYFRLKDGKLYSPSTLPEGRGFTPLDVRLKARNEFAAFVARASEIRDAQERKVGHDPAAGHLRFSSAWYLDIERDRVRLFKGDTAYGEFGLDEKGRMRVNTNVVGGRFGGEYLEAALDNQRVFHKNDGPAEVLARIGEKCLDDGFIPDEERAVKTNMELMIEDLALIQGDIPRAEPVSQDEMAERKAETRVRHDYGASSEAQTFDEALYSSMHKGAVFTIGHSNLDMDAFVANLRRNGITVVRDVRSWPHSKAFPHFNQEELKGALEKAGIRYIYNGDVMGGHIRRTELPSEGDGVRFTLSEGGYAQRTRENASRADLTLAFAVDFSTAGEKVTEQAAGDKLIQVSLSRDSLLEAAAKARSVFDCLTPQERSSILTVNIAGNGMQTLAARGIGQKEINAYVHDFLGVLQDMGIRFGGIISGGQTGADEAGIVAARALGIPAEVHAPKGWAMRGADGRDLFSEYAFKERFITMPAKDLSYEEMTRTDGFRKVYEEIVSDARKGERQAVMCAETSPTDCHRFACIGYALSHPSLVGRRFNPVEVQHIKRDGSIISQEALERKMCRDAAVEYNEKGLQGVMRKAAERIQHPKAAEKAISLSRSSTQTHRRR